ncbi:hypothetical protein [Streptomyces lydicus]|uniref:hypothetical protein n=1 Tax=Streptomyces lydicus TaxID=47763 RepID=UPI0036E44108
MTDFVEFDADHIEQLSQEIRQSGADLADCLARYQERCADAGSGYGSLPAAGPAGKEHDLSTRDVARMLSDLKEKSDVQAEALLTAASRYRSFDTDADSAIASLNRVT